MAGKLLKQTEIAELFGVERSTVHAWEAKGLPYTGEKRDKKYNSVEVIDWWVQQKVDKAKKPYTDVDKKKSDLQLEKLSLEVALSQLDLDEKAGELVRVDDVVKELENDYTIIRTKLLGLPGKLAPQVAVIENPKEIKDILSDEINETLMELSQKIDSSSNDEC